MENLNEALSDLPSDAENRQAKVSSRFDYVKYDEQSGDDQEAFKVKCQSLEQSIETLNSPRAKYLALAKLEETYMWIGKAIRDDQIVRNGSAPLQEERTNS